ncbi:MAG: hypothetical protein HYY06_02515 [Deltaproteobacteria bacterium]|nr:hypothetical protein [Deltaproteobacteria bacterium]
MGFSLKIALIGLEQLEAHGLDAQAWAGYRRLYGGLGPTEGGAARISIVEALVRLGLTQGPDRFDESCALWRSLGPCGAEEGVARSAAMALVRIAMARGRASEALAIARAEHARAPNDVRALYATGCLSAVLGDEAGADRAFERAERSDDARVAALAHGRRIALPIGPRPGIEDDGKGTFDARARLALAKRLSRSGGRYARARGLDLLLGLAREGHTPAPLLEAAAAHVDRTGARLTEIEADRIRELVRRVATEDVAGSFLRHIDLCARLAKTAAPGRLAMLAGELDRPTAELARILERGTARVYPVVSEPRLALAAETLRVRDALDAAGPMALDRLEQLVRAAGPEAGTVSTLWALVPCFVRRHAELGLARDRLRPLVAAVLESGPLTSLDLAAVARAFDALGEPILADLAARRAADEGDAGPLVERTARRAWELAESAPEEALRLLERARTL